MKELLELGYNDFHLNLQCCRSKKGEINDIITYLEMNEEAITKKKPTPVVIAPATE
jgi:hypothetical protein